jgi:hypothetical protein
MNDCTRCSVSRMSDAAYDLRLHGAETLDNAGEPLLSCG